MSRIVAAALALLFALAAPAYGAPPWYPPQPIPHARDGFPQLVVSATGGALAAWSELPPLRLVGASRGHGDAVDAFFTAAAPIGELQLAGLATYGSDRVLALGTTRTGHPHAIVLAGSTSGGFGGPRSLVTTADSEAIALAANRAGDAAALVRGCVDSSCGRAIPYLAVRHSGGRFKAPIRLGPSGVVRAGAVAVNGSGDVLAVWERPLRGSSGTRGIYARIRRASGRLGSTRRLGTAVSLPTISAALGDRRRAIVAWLGQRVSESDALSPATIQASVSAPGGPFGTAQTLEEVPVTGIDRYVGQAGVRAAIGVDRRPLIAWTGFEGGHFVVRAAPIVGTAITVGQVVSDPAQETMLSDLATGPRGQAAVIGVQGLRGALPVGPVSVVAATRPAGAPEFGAVEAISAPATFAEAARAGFDPEGRVLAVWRSLAPTGVQWSLRDPGP